MIAGNPVKELKAIKRIRIVLKAVPYKSPSEIYPDFGMKPFASAPKLIAARAGLLPDCCPTPVTMIG